MTFIDTNLTYSQQVCDFAIGGIIGGTSVLYFLGRFLLLCLGFYAVYRVTEILIRRKRLKGDAKK